MWIIKSGLSAAFVGTVRLEIYLPIARQVPKRKREGREGKRKKARKGEREDGRKEKEKKEKK